MKIEIRTHHRLVKGSDFSCLVEVNGLEPVTLCRLADDEPGCNKEKEKALTFVSAFLVEVNGLEPLTLCL